MVKTRSQASTNPPVTDERRSKRKSVATPAGNCDSPDHVLSLQFDSAAATKPVGNKSKSRLSKIPSTRKKSKAPSKPAPEIANLTLPCFIEIFKLCDQRERHHVLPLVCKQWAKILRAPSAAWQVSFSSPRQMCHLSVILPLHLPVLTNQHEPPPFFHISFAETNYSSFPRNRGILHEPQHSTSACT